MEAAEVEELILKKQWNYIRSIRRFSVTLVISWERRLKLVLLQI